MRYRAQLTTRSSIWVGDATVLVIDEPGFLKQGKASCGVARQYTGSAGKVTNCQIGVFGAYMPVQGHALSTARCTCREGLDRRPVAAHGRSCARGHGVCSQAGAGDEMIDRAVASNMSFAWIAADAVYGVGAVKQALRRPGKGYVLGVKGDHRFGSWGDRPVAAGTAAQIASGLAPTAWQRLSAGIGTMGQRLHDWAYRTRRPRRRRI